MPSVLTRSTADFRTICNEILKDSKSYVVEFLWHLQKMCTKFSANQITKDITPTNCIRKNGAFARINFGSSQYLEHFYRGLDKNHVDIT